MPEGSKTTLKVKIGSLQKNCQVEADWLQLRKLDKPIADMFYVSYRIAGKNRPVTFVFNGGPGAASAYLHMGALGPKRVRFESDGACPPPPPNIRKKCRPPKSRLFERLMSRPPKLPPGLAKEWTGNGHLRLAISISTGGE